MIRSFSVRIARLCALVLCALALEISESVSNRLVAQTSYFDENALRRHVELLASDSLKGRGTGTEDERKAAEYIAAHFRSLGLEPKGDNGTYFQTFHLIKKNDVLPDSNRAARNVVALLNNGAARTIVVGAHYDHLGLGYDGSSLDPQPKGKIHNGADDNASGVAGVLEVARRLASNGAKEPVNYLFLCFSGEELGLLGSKHFADNPTIPLETVQCMVNFDMIGRLDAAKKSLLLGGVGTSPVFVPFLDSLAKTPEFRERFVISFDSAGVGPSDHTSFYLKKIPVLFFFTGSHSDYHKPTDDADKINYGGMTAVLSFASRALEYLERQPALTFATTRAPVQTGHSYKVSLGVMPSYSFDGEGLKLDAVTEGRPAAKAGIKGGDVIIQIGERKIATIQDYMKALSALKAGDTPRVKVLRDGAEMEFVVGL
jgi:hypothetical protein